MLVGEVGVVGVPEVEPVVVDVPVLDPVVDPDPPLVSELELLVPLVVPVVPVVLVVLVVVLPVLPPELLVPKDAIASALRLVISC